MDSRRGRGCKLQSDPKERIGKEEKRNTVDRSILLEAKAKALSDGDWGNSRKV
jgi:hypothetical protein